MTKTTAAWTALGLLALGGYWLAGHPTALSATHPVDWRSEPDQSPTDRAPFERSTRHGTFRIVPRAAYEVGAVVAHVDRYRFDHLAPLVPLDAVLTWGKLPEVPYRGRVAYDQMARFYLWSTHARNLDLRYIATHSANTHLLPSDSNLRKAILHLGRGDRIRIRGLLVDLVDGEGHTFKTSLTRTDTGAGACEVLWVQELQVGDRLYR